MIPYRATCWRLEKRLRRRLSVSHSSPFSSSSLKWKQQAPNVVFARCNSTNTNEPMRETPRVNPVGIQHLSLNLQKKVFPRAKEKAVDPQMLKIAEKHLDDNGLLGKLTQIKDPIQINNFPKLMGENTLDEHFHKIASVQAEPYLSMATSFLSNKVKLPKKPDSWLFASGWTRYEPGKPPQPVPYPLENEIVFDVETLYKKSQFSVLATAVTTQAWYGWVSPYLVEYSKDSTFSDMEYLIPFNTLNEPKLMVGYNVAYDRARVLEEYNLNASKAFYLDAMSLHVATTGITSQQRGRWLKYKKLIDQTDEESSLMVQSKDEFEISTADTANIAQDDQVIEELQNDPWLAKSSLNSLAIVAEHHCKIKLNKSTRNAFSTTELKEIIDDFQNLMTYCADDVNATFKVAQKLFPQFRKKVPHAVSFAALKQLGSLILPTTKKWDNYVSTAELLYQENREILLNKLKNHINKILDDQEHTDVESDPWLQQLDWTIKQPRLNKDGQPTKRQAYLVGYPEWYRELFKTTTVKDYSRDGLSVLNRTRMIPIFLRLSWEGYPLFWTNKHGWCFKVPLENEIIKEMEEKRYNKVIFHEDDDFMVDLNSALYKVPHPDGPDKRCTLLMGKNFQKYFDNGVVTSDSDIALEILKLNSISSYWIGNRKRIQDQFVVYSDPKFEKNNFFNEDQSFDNSGNMGIILPKICPMGTITRRATENTWLTASNAKKNKIGTELKALIEAPEGYVFVGADVDSEELWIASLIGDSVFKMHGGTALGWMTLEGNKNEKTDLHSKTAEILGISRNHAKVFNYGRIYGAGVKFAQQLLMQFNPSVTEEEAEKTAKKLYQKTKGVTRFSKVIGQKLNFGGSESIMFNKLEEIAYEENPRTPVLGASITAALKKENLKKNQYLTSRVNWSIQSSGVDYLHLLVISMQHLSERYNIPVRLIITVHDEVRYLCKKEDRYKVALLLQISNVWTRAIFCQEMGINEVPQSCAFFSEVDIDHVLRKEVGLDCVTPSHPEAIPSGESLDIVNLLQKCDNGNFLEENKTFVSSYDNIPYKQRQSVLSHSSDTKFNKKQKIAFVRLQCSTSTQEWNSSVKQFQEASTMKENNKMITDQLKTKDTKNDKWSLKRNNLKDKSESSKKKKSISRKDYDILSEIEESNLFHQHMKLNESGAENSQKRKTHSKKDMGNRINAKMKIDYENAAYAPPIEVAKRQDVLDTRDIYNNREPVLPSITVNAVN